METGTSFPEWLVVSPPRPVPLVRPFFLAYRCIFSVGERSPVRQHRLGALNLGMPAMWEAFAGGLLRCSNRPGNNLAAEWRCSVFVVASGVARFLFPALLFWRRLNAVVRKKKTQETSVKRRHVDKGRHYLRRPLPWAATFSPCLLDCPCRCFEWRGCRRDVVKFLLFTSFKSDRACGATGSCRCRF